MMQDFIWWLLSEKESEVLARCRDVMETTSSGAQIRTGRPGSRYSYAGSWGTGFARKIQKEKLATRVVLLTAELDEGELLEAIRLGIQGIVLKEIAPQMVLRCMRKAHAGEQWIELRSAKKALEKMLRREAGVQAVAAILTSQEMTIVRMIASGLRNKKIADKLHISEGTVKVHIHNIYEKLHVNSRLTLLRYA